MKFADYLFKVGLLSTNQLKKMNDMRLLIPNVYTFSSKNLHGVVKAKCFS